MKNFKNKFIFIVILLIVSIFAYEAYWAYIKVDTNSYVLLIKWQWLINDKTINLNIKNVLKPLDKVKTIWKDSLAIIEWWDSSVTRLWWNTEIIVKENFVSSDLSKINISFNMTSWKTWSKIISMLTKWSYFKLYVDDNEAAVRWTVFEVDKDNQYIYVQDHEVTLKSKSGKDYLIKENSPFSIDTFSFIDLQKFINEKFDKTWEDLNKKLDTELTEKLKVSLLENKTKFYSFLAIFSKKYDILNSIKSWDSLASIKEKLNSLDNEWKKIVYDKVFSEYQKINFLSPKDDKYNEKLKYKEVLINTSNDKDNTESLLKNTGYDINKIISSKDLTKLNDSIAIFSNNKDKLKENNIDIKQYFSLDNQIPKELKDILIENFKPLKDMLDLDSFFKLNDIKENLQEDAKNKINSLINVFK